MATAAPDRAPRTGRRLRPSYYLDNFETLLADVERHHGALLSNAERAFLDGFRRLPLDARRLYVRLLSRRGPWFRRDSLRYSEIDCEAACEALLVAGHATASGATQEERLALARRAELAALCASPGLFGAVVDPAHRGLRRRGLTAAAREALGRDEEGAAAFAERLPLLRLEHLQAVDVCRLLFFGSLGRDLAEFVLADLGKSRYEPVAIDPAHSPFRNRNALEEHLRLNLLRDRALALPARGSRADATLELLDAVRAIARQASWHDSTRSLRDRLLVWAGRELERRGDLDGALEIFAATQAPPSRERRVRILTRLGRAADASILQAEIAASPRDESELAFARRGGPRRRLRRTEIPFMEVALATQDAAKPIEQAALGALEARGYAGFFAENWLWRSLCGLALWDLVFAPLPGAFTHRFQTGPHDLHDGFRAAREPAIGDRLAALAREARPGRRLLDLWDEKYPTANRLVTFAAELRPSLELAAAALDGARMAAVLDRLSRDLRRHGAGLPDLFLVDPQGEILLAEVKSPTDVLRPEQAGWIEYLNRHGLPTVVLHVHRRGG
jgi:hypothetical protein